MAIDYYLADVRGRRLCEVGTHRDVYCEALQQGADEWGRDRKLFQLWCAWRAYDQVSWASIGCELRDGEWTPDEAARWVAERAGRIYDFIHESGFHTELVNDCDDSLFKYDGCCITHSIYDPPSSGVGRIVGDP